MCVNVQRTQKTYKSKIKTKPIKAEKPNLVPTNALYANASPWIKRLGRHAGCHEVGKCRTRDEIKKEKPIPIYP